MRASSRKCPTSIAHVYNMAGKVRTWRNHQTSPCSSKILRVPSSKEAVSRAKTLANNHPLDSQEGSALSPVALASLGMLNATGGDAARPSVMARASKRLTRSRYQHHPVKLKLSPSYYTASAGGCEASCSRSPHEATEPSMPAILPPRGSQ